MLRCSILGRSIACKVGLDTSIEASGESDGYVRGKGCFYSSGRKTRRSY